MAKVSVIYHAPKGDNKVCEWGEHTFFDGHATEVEDNPDNAHMLMKMKNHPHFELSEMGEMSRQAVPPFAEMRRGEPAYPRPEVEEPEVEAQAAFEDYVPIEDAMIKRKRGRLKKFEKEDEQEDEPEASQSEPEDAA